MVSPTAARRVAVIGASGYGGLQTLRLLQDHARIAERSAHALVHAPRVIEAAEHAMRAFPADETVQHYGALVVVGLSALQPADVAKAHGAHGVAAIAEASVRLALSTPRPATVRVGGADWQEAVLALHPRLRSRRQA